VLENKIESKVREYALSLGFLVYKFTSPARAAVPDRLFIYKGKHFFIEFKATGKKPTPAQEREHAKLRGGGATVFVVDDINKGKFILDMIHLGAKLDRIIC
jgi:hypothetical protein